MYARYVYKAGATPANILADLCALLCGTTDKTLLSADCIQADTEICFGYNPATWVMHDNAASATGKVLKQRAADNSCDKFLHLDISTTVIKSDISETWNASTHTGTRMPSGTFAGYSRGNISTSSGVILIYTDPYVVAMTTKTSAWYPSYLLCAEFTRSGVNSALAVGYPNFAADSASNRLSRTRAKNPTSTGDYTGLGVVALISPGDSINDPFYLASYRNSVDTLVTAAYSVKDFPLFGVTGTISAADYLGFCPTPLKVVNTNTGTTLDEAVIDGMTFVKGYNCYSLFPTYAAYLLPKG